MPCAGIVIEVELKAPVPETALAALRARLGVPLAVEEHADAYFQHPSRDFAATDEAVRVSRRGARAELTYKGPRLDVATKSRREVTLAIDDADAASEMLALLGFREVMTVRKTRALHHVAGFEVALDDVPGLGAFVEVERLVADDAARAGVEAEARALLSSWGLRTLERRSYLELLMAQARRPRAA